MSAPAPALPPDLVAGLKRLKLAQVRAIAPDILATAKVQRWAPEELLRTLVDAEIEARDARGRLRSAGFPVTKTLDEFNLGLSSVPQATWDYLASLEWVRAAENPVPGGPRRHRQVPRPDRIGPRRRHRRHAGALLRRRRPGRALYRGMADNSVARIIDSVAAGRPGHRRRARLRPPRPGRQPAAVPLRGRRHERRSLGIASHWPFEAWGWFLPEHTTAASVLDRLLHHALVVVTEGESYRMREARQKGGRAEESA